MLQRIYRDKDRSEIEIVPWHLTRPSWRQHGSQSNIGDTSVFKISEVSIQITEVTHSNLFPSCLSSIVY